MASSARKKPAKIGSRQVEPSVACHRQMNSHGRCPNERAEIAQASIMSSGSDTLSVLIAHIYDAAIDPSQWPATLEKVGQFVPGCHANLVLHDAVRQSANALFVSADDPDYRRLYLDQYARLNPVFQALDSRNVGEVYSANDILPPARCRRTPFYKEWQQPQGFIDAVAAVLDRSP